MNTKPPSLNALLTRAVTVAMLKQLIVASVLLEFEARTRKARIPAWLLG